MVGPFYRVFDDAGYRTYVYGRYCYKCANEYAARKNEKDEGEHRDKSKRVWAH